MNAQRTFALPKSTKEVELPQDFGGRFEEFLEQWTTPEEMANKLHKIAQRYLWFVMNNKEAVDNDCRDAIFLISELIDILTPNKINPLNP